MDYVSKLEIILLKTLRRDVKIINELLYYKDFKRLGEFKEAEPLDKHYVNAIRTDYLLKINQLSKTIKEKQKISRLTPQDYDELEELSKKLF